MEEAIFEKLRVYQQAIQFVIYIYKLTSKFPSTEKYNLVSQFKRAAVSIVLNIAESQGKQTIADKRNFLSMAKGSAYEIIALIEIAKQIGYVDQLEYQKLRSDVFSLIKQLNQFMINVRGRN